MGNSLIIDHADTTTVELKVMVQFAKKGGGLYQGDFLGEFRRLPQDRVDVLCDEDESYRNSEVLDEILVGVSGIGRADGTELPADEAMAWVKKTPECVNAAVTAFFRTMRPERYNEKTRRRQRGRG